MCLKLCQIGVMAETEDWDLREVFPAHSREQLQVMADNHIGVKILHGVGGREEERIRKCVILFGGHRLVLAAGIGHDIRHAENMEGQIR